MDVRCEKCGTEYELDETRLKPGGVTVKCTTCGHMFKIRRRASTNVGMPATGPLPASNRSGRAEAVPRPQTQTGAGSGPNDRNWIIRLDNGDTLLTGPVTDQAALYGLLRKVRNLGMPLLSVNRIQLGENS